MDCVAYYVWPLLPSFWVLGDPSSLSSAGCVFHPEASTSASRSPSADDTFHSATQDTRPRHHPPDRPGNDADDGVMRSEGTHLEMLQLSDVAFTLADQLPHLIVVFLLLHLPVGLLPLLLLQRKLEEDRVE